LRGPNPESTVKVSEMKGNAKKNILSALCKQRPLSASQKYPISPSPPGSKCKLQDPLVTLSMWKIASISIDSKETKSTYLQRNSKSGQLVWIAIV
jgi:hypothetical protein